VRKTIALLVVPVVLAVLPRLGSAQYPPPPVTTPTTLFPLQFPSLTPPSLTTTTWVTPPRVSPVPEVYRGRSPTPEPTPEPQRRRHERATTPTTTTTTTTVTWPAAAIQASRAGGGLSGWAILAIVALGAAAGYFSAGTRK